MKKLISLLLALVLALSILPMAAMAAEDSTTNNSMENYYNNIYKEHPDLPEYFEKHNITVKGDTIYLPAKKPADWPDYLYDYWAQLKKEEYVEEHTHKYGLQITRSGHYYTCDCGAQTAITPHIDPANAVNGRCTCGYKFMDNADLTVLWLDDIRLTTPFRKDKTEYEAKTVSYKDVTETKIRVRSFDAMAKVELPEDLTIKKGTNKFEIKVTAEDGKTTKTYTITVTKE